MSKKISWSRKVNAHKAMRRNEVSIHGCEK